MQTSQTYKQQALPGLKRHKHVTNAYSSKSTNKKDSYKPRTSYGVDNNNVNNFQALLSHSQPRLTRRETKDVEKKKAVSLQGSPQLLLSNTTG